MSSIEFQITAARFEYQLKLLCNLSLRIAFIYEKILVNIAKTELTHTYETIKTGI